MFNDEQEFMLNECNDLHDSQAFRNIFDAMINMFQRNNNGTFSFKEDVNNEEIFSVVSKAVQQGSRLVIIQYNVKYT